MNDSNEGGKNSEKIKMAKRRKVMRRLVGFNSDKED